MAPKKKSAKEEVTPSVNQEPKRRGRPPKSAVAPAKSDPVIVSPVAVSPVNPSDVKKQVSVKKEVKDVKEADEAKNQVLAEDRRADKSSAPKPSKSSDLPVAVPKEAPKKRGRKAATETVSKGVEKSVGKSTDDFPTPNQESTPLIPDKIENKGMFKVGTPSIPNFMFDFPEENIPTDTTSSKVKRLDFN
jgi:hypothetical protein